MVGYFRAFLYEFYQDAEKIFRVVEIPGEDVSMRKCKVNTHKLSTMNQKFFAFLIFFLAGPLIPLCTSQNLVIQAVTGDENSFRLNNIQRMVFRNGNLVLVKTDSQEESVPLADLQKIFFSELPSAIPGFLKNASSSGIKLFPNPAGDNLHITGVPEGTSAISIYRLDGALVMKARVTSGENLLDLKVLSPGIYLLRTNTQSIKFIRQ
jgi:hypothetical protein